MDQQVISLTAQRHREEIADVWRRHATFVRRLNAERNGAKRRRSLSRRNGKPENCGPVSDGLGKYKTGVDS